MPNIKNNSIPITVLMSVYNGARYLREAIDSILNQTFRDFEFVIINDASIDSSQDIIESYHDPRIRCIHNQINLGLTKSLNIGLHAARGSYIARIDNDDISYPLRLEVQYHFLETNPKITLVGSWADFCDEYGIARHTRHTPTDQNVIKYELIFGNAFFHSSIMFRKYEIMDAGGYSESYRYAQDYELYSRLIHRYTLANIPQSLIKFRLHKGSVVATPTSQRIVRENALTLMYQNMAHYLPALTKDEFNAIKDLLIMKQSKKRATINNLLHTLHVNRRIFQSYQTQEKVSSEHLRSITKLYYRRIKLVLSRFIRSYAHPSLT